MLALAILLGGGSLFLTLQKAEKNTLSKLNTPTAIKHYGVAEMMELIGMADSTEGEARVLILDVRPRVFFEAGSILNALSFPEKNFDQVFSKHKDILTEAQEQERPIILYCASSHCQDAEKVHQKLSKKGIHSGIYSGGWADWAELGLPTN